MPSDFVGRLFFRIFGFTEDTYARKNSNLFGFLLTISYLCRMKLKINRKTVEVFEGAQVRHALLSYFALKGLDVCLVKSLTVYDRWGHEIDQDAPASQFDVVKFKLPQTKTIKT